MSSNADPRLPDFVQTGVDGLNYINIYSRGATHLGQRLSNLHQVPFWVSPEWCPYVSQPLLFQSIEALWFYVSSNATEAHLMEFQGLHGIKAKTRGTELREHLGKRTISEEVFKDLIIRAMYEKTYQQPDYIQHELIVSEGKKYMPFAHYYLGSNGFKVYAGYQWIVEAWEKLRIEVKLQQLNLTVGHIRKDQVTPNDFDVSRNTLYGNDWSHLPASKATHKTDTRDEAVKCHRKHVKELIDSGNMTFISMIKRIPNNARLKCFCWSNDIEHDRQSCHAFNLIDAKKYAIQLGYF
jgi:hypothetical protein